MRSDLRNQLDAVKNEAAKSKADWEREKKRIARDHENHFAQVESEWTSIKDTELRQAKEKTEKLWRKKLDDRERDYE